MRPTHTLLLLKWGVVFSASTVLLSNSLPNPVLLSILIRSQTQAKPATLLIPIGLPSFCDGESHGFRV
jgi:hypothetical protein